jgi:hypothetical protein
MEGYTSFPPQEIHKKKEKKKRKIPLVTTSEIGLNEVGSTVPSDPSRILNPRRSRLSGCNPMITRSNRDPHARSTYIPSGYDPKVSREARTASRHAEGDPYTRTCSSSGSSGQKNRDTIARPASAAEEEAEAEEEEGEGAGEEDAAMMGISTRIRSREVRIPSFMIRRYDDALVLPAGACMLTRKSSVRVKFLPVSRGEIRRVPASYYIFPKFKKKRDGETMRWGGQSAEKKKTPLEENNKTFFFFFFFEKGKKKHAR